MRVVTPAELRALAMSRARALGERGGYRARGGRRGRRGGGALARRARAAALEWAPPPRATKKPATPISSTAAAERPRDDFRSTPRRGGRREARGLRRAPRPAVSVPEYLEKIRREREAHLSKELDALESERMQLTRPSRRRQPGSARARAQAALARPFGRPSSACTRRAGGRSRAAEALVGGRERLATAVRVPGDARRREATSSATDLYRGVLTDA